MKKLFIAAIALTSLCAASFAQAVPAKNAVAPKMQVVKTTTAKKTEAKVVAISKPAPVTVTKTAVVSKPAVVTKTVVVSKPVAVTKTVVVTKPGVVTKTVSASPVKKDGTPDKRFKASAVTPAGPLKKDGSADMRYKSNKKN